jgi:hypothetical protein
VDKVPIALGAMAGTPPGLLPGTPVSACDSLDGSVSEDLCGDVLGLAYALHRVAA